MEAPIFRFKEFNAPYVEMTLGELFDERTERAVGNEELLSVTQSNGVIKQSESDKKNVASENKSNYKKVNSGDIAYNSMRMWQGAEGLSEYDGIVSPAYTILIPKNIYAKYFEYKFKTQKMTNLFQRFSQGLTSDTWNLKYPQFSQLKVTIPSIEEQKKVTDFLSIIDERISLQEKKLSAAKSQKIGFMQKLFSQEIRFKNGDTNFPDTTTCLLKDLSEFITVGIANSATHAYCNDGIVMFRNQNIKENRLDDTEVIYIDETFEKKYKNKRLKENDILVARTGYPGTACIVPKEYENAQTFTTLIVRLKQEIVIPEYICQFINSPLGKAYINSTQIGGGQKNSGAGILEKMPILVPCLDEQRLISEKLKIFDDKIFNEQSMLDNWLNIKKGLLQQLFT